MLLLFVFKNRNVFFYLDVVAELTSSPLCDKTLKNKDGLSPAEVVCSRCKEGKDLRYS